MARSSLMLQRDQPAITIGGSMRSPESAPDSRPLDTAN